MKKNSTSINTGNFRPKTLPYLVALGLGAAVVSPAVGRSGDSAAAFTATQLIRQFTLKNTVAQVSQGMQGHVEEVNGVLRAREMGARPNGYPFDMGSVPSSANLPQRDGAGRPLGYCAWDNNSSISNSSFLAGQGAPNPLVYAVVSPGLNGSMETSCTYVLANLGGLGDDYVQVTVPSQTSSRQFRSAVGTYADLTAMPGEEGDVRLVLDTNKLYSYVGGTWQPVDASKFNDDSASNGAGAIAYTTGKVTVADFQAASATITGALAGSTATFSSSLTASGFIGNGAALTDLNASNVSSGVLGAAFGGTGVDSSAAAQGSLLIGTGAGFALGAISAGDGIGVLNSAGSITISNTGVLGIAGTNNQVIASAMNGDVVLSLPQDIAMTSTPTFAGAFFNGNVDVSSISQAGVPATLAFQYASDTGSTFYAEPNLGLGTGALAGRKNAGNVAVGNGVLGQMATTGYGTESGTWNTGVGYQALYTNDYGDENTALGYKSMFSNTTGSENSALGTNALRGNVTGDRNSAFGFNANVLSGSLNYASAIGADSRVGTSNTIVLGAVATNKNSAYSTIDDQIVIGSTSRNDTYPNTRLYVEGDTYLNGGLFAANATYSGSVTANSFVGNGSALADLNADNISSGVLGSALGGTGVDSSSAAAGSLLIGTGAGFALGGITAGDGIGVLNVAGNITIDNTGATSFNSRTGAITLTQGDVTTAVSSGSNLGIGILSFASMTTGFYNTALGAWTMRAISTGGSNTAIGTGSQEFATGSSNTSLGREALRVVTGSDNTAVGRTALEALTTGNSNVALGRGAGNALTTGSNNSLLGTNANTVSDALIYATALGADSQVSTNNTIVLGRTVDTTVIGATGSATGGILQNKILQVTGDVGISGNLVIGGTFAATSFSGNGAALTDLNASNISSGILGAAFGGTGVDSSSAAAGSLLIGNGTGYTLGTLTAGSGVSVTNGAGSITITNTGVINITGTNDQVIASASNGDVVLSLPQNIAATSTPTFAGAFFNGNIDVASISRGGVPVTLAFQYASDTNSTFYPEPNLGLGTGALAGRKSAGNVAIGADVLGKMATLGYGDESGSWNTGVGYQALYNNDFGDENTAIGYKSLYANVSGYYNTAIGSTAMESNTSGFNNTAVGYHAMHMNTGGRDNASFGYTALHDNATGRGNAAFGSSAMYSTTGSENTSVGTSSLSQNVTGNRNSAFGFDADVFNGGLNYASAIGADSRVGTSNTMVLGALAVNKESVFSTVDDQIVIGATSRNDTYSNTKLYVNGAALFSRQIAATGGALVSSNQYLRFGEPTETSDPMAIYRTNAAADQSRLRIGIGDNPSTFGGVNADELQVGLLGLDLVSYTPVFRIAGSGDVIANGYVQATAFYTSSDHRLKTNIQAQNSDSVLSRLEQLQTYSYEYLANPNLGRRIGVIAQEIQNLFPEAVATRADGMLSVDYSALGAMAAMGVGQLSMQVKVLDKTVEEQGQRITALDDRVNLHDTRITSLEGWKTEAVKRMDGMQNAIDLNIQKIAENAVAIQTNTAAIERLDDTLFTLDGQVKNNSDLINNINSRWAQNFSESADGSQLTVNAAELMVSNFTAQQVRANSVYSQRLEAEMARIADLEVNNLRANSAVANRVQAEQVNTGSTQVYAGVGLPAILFAAKSDGHYTVNTSALDGSYATATVIVNAGQAKVVSVASEGIELYAEGNVVKALAAGKSIKASWIKTG